MEARAEESAALGAEAPVEAYLDDPAAPTTADDRRRRRDDADRRPDGSDDDHAATSRPSRKPVKKTRGRASVPSWDEIMFGGGSQD